MRQCGAPQVISAARDGMQGRSITITECLSSLGRRVRFFLDIIFIPETSNVEMHKFTLSYVKMQGIHKSTF